jgi:cephalosporin-C deacetylase
VHAYHAVATCVLASSLTKRAPRYTSPRVPRSGRSSSFGWVEGRRLLVERGSGAEVATFLERHPQYPEDDLQTVLSYFDAALLAPAVGCPTVVGLGVVDHVVPFASVQAIVVRLRAPLEVMTFPVSHDAGPAMRAWDRFDERWLGLALRGVPSGFGQRDPRSQRSAAASRTQAR